LGLIVTDCCRVSGCGAMVRREGQVVWLGIIDKCCMYRTRDKKPYKTKVWRVLAREATASIVLASRHVPSGDLLLVRHVALLVATFLPLCACEAGGIVLETGGTRCRALSFVF